MRFGSPYQNLQVILWHQSLERLADGQWRVKPPTEEEPYPNGFTAQFRGADWDEYERGLLFARFGNVIRMGSRFADETLTTPAPMEWRIGTFDTASVQDPVLRARVEKALVQHPDEGREFMLMEKPKVAAPWPGYDSLVVKGRRTLDHVLGTVRTIVEQAGIDPDVVAEYERANLNRPEVLALCAEIQSAKVDSVDDDLVTA